MFETFSTKLDVEVPEGANDGVFYIFGTPISGNLGDQAIAMAQSRFCRIILITQWLNFKLMRH
ncbi:Uncharacterised protein [Weissella viridescens]|uniref:Uncharacterized protein n=1 Tax=Weissella viridescens TaxID=1629 RepID=A0A380NWF3_WEIVI|nr:Uncharacterised protein [Weissella viridescens]